MITLDHLNYSEAVRYLGDARVKMNDTMEALLKECEEQVLSVAEPKYLYKIIDLPCEELIMGEDIQKHLAGCQQAVLLCATLGVGIDRMLRIEQVKDMSKAVVLDTLASVAIEQVCQKFDAFIAETFPDRYQTFRFSPGYGDYPIEMQKYFLTELNAPKKIGLTTNDNYLLIPTKSVTAVCGLSDTELPKRKRGCATCNLKGSCNYRQRGDHCGF